MNLTDEVRLEPCTAEPSMTSLVAFVVNRSFDLSLPFFTLYESGQLEQMAYTVRELLSCPKKLHIPESAHSSVVTFLGL
jgi:hypothetical protein